MFYFHLKDISPSRFLVSALLVASCVPKAPCSPNDPGCEDFVITQLARCLLNEPDCQNSNDPPTPTVASIQPNAITGLTLWLKADAGITTATGVSSWADQSGNGNDATQVTATSQPAFIASEPGLNNQPVLRFDKLNDFLLLTNTFGNASGSNLNILVVAKANSATCVTPNYCAILSTRWDSTSSWGWTWMWNGPVTGYYHSGGGGGVPGGYPVSVNQYHILELKRAGLNIRLGIDGVIGANNVLTGFTPGSSTRIGEESNGATRYLDGDIAEIVLYNTTVSDAEWQGVECYLSKKYGIAVSQTCQ